MTTKMNRKDIPSVRKMLVAKQNGLCPICGKDLTRTQAVNQVIDHDHKTGFVRAVVHRGCNKVEGSVYNTVQRWGKAATLTSVIGTLKRVIAFWELHQTPQTDIIYYSHKTEAEKRVSANAKRRREYAKRKDSQVE